MRYRIQVEFEADSQAEADSIADDIQMALESEDSDLEVLVIPLDD